MTRVICESGYEWLTSLDRTTLVDQTLSIIRKHLYKDAKLVNDPKSKQLKINGIDSILSPDQRIVELTDIEILDNNLGSSERIKNRRGFYNYEDDRIYLIKNKWCRKTLYHEILHACSITSRFPAIGSRYYGVFEGLTDFYSGYLLYKTSTNSYMDCWGENSQKHCQVTYKDDTRQWLTFCNFFSLKDTFKFYFYRDNCSWEKMTNEFTDSVKKTVPAFYNPFSTKRNNCFMNIFSCLSNQFGNSFEEKEQNQIFHDFDNIEKNMISCNHGI